MIDHNAFLQTIMDKPSELGPMMVYADWLQQEYGDPRGELLAMMPEIIETVTGLRTLPMASFEERTAAVRYLYTNPQRRLFLALQARYTPLIPWIKKPGPQKQLHEMQPDICSQRSITTALLYAMKLATDLELTNAMLDAARVVALLASRRPSEDAQLDDILAARVACYASGHNVLQMARSWPMPRVSYRWQLNLIEWMISDSQLPTSIRRLLWRINKPK